ncbi:hypothetical protein NGM33_24250 [Nocardiopsis dassonvillei]|jgi:chorismate synthase|uniref:hypothetical protein n=1 Tax=Nocardiopsis dassonvillei TaxID=2014 RepID=UPI0010F1964E|nr:hypothetical protein [Nocardiopsis dassonvillei]MCP3016446.1 hypothetical protein [Nocardiopsis dassonvillei]
MTYRGAGHRSTRRTVTVVTYALAGAVTAAVLAAAVWLGAVTVQGVWAYALSRVTEGP